MSLTRTLCIGLLLVGGCKKADEAKAPEPAASAVDKDKAAKPPEPPPPPATKGGEALVARYNECNGFFVGKDWDKLAGCFTDDAKGVISDAHEFTGGKAIAEGVFKAFADGFPDAKLEPQLTLVNGKNLAAVMWFHGTNTGPLMGMPATGKPAGFNGMRTATFTDDGSKMTWDLHVADLSTLMGQLGMSPAPHRPVVEKGWDQPTVVIATDGQVERDNAATIGKLCDAFNTHDTAALSALFAPDAVVHDMTAPGDIAGWPANEKMFKEIFGGLPDIKGTCTSWAAGDFVVNQVDWTATHTGDMPSMGLKKTGKSLKIHDSEVYQLKDGKVTHYWRFSNGLAMAMQLGLVPPPGEAPAKGKEPGKGKEPEKGKKPGKGK